MTHLPPSIRSFLSGVTMRVVPSSKGVHVEMDLPGAGEDRLRIALSGMPGIRGGRLSFAAGWNGSQEPAALAEGLLAFGYQPLPIAVPPSRGLGDLGRKRRGQTYVPEIRVSAGTRNLIVEALVAHLGKEPSPEGAESVVAMVRLAAIVMHPALPGLPSKKALGTLRCPAGREPSRPLR